MKILLISNIFPPGFIGGYELGAFEVADGLAALGHQVRVLTSDYLLPMKQPDWAFTVERSLALPPLQHELHHQPHSDTQGKYFVFHNIRRIAAALSDWEPHLLLLFNIQGLGALALLRFVSASGIPAVQYLMDNPLFGIRPESDEYKAFVRVFGDTPISPNISFIAMSRSVAQQTGESLCQEISPDLFVPGWIRLEAYCPASQISSHDGKVRFVFCSRIAPHKGTEITLDAIEALSRDGERNFSVDFYGSGQVAQFIQSIRARGLSGFANYAGSLPKEAMTRAFSSYDALLFPTWEREPFGFVVSEAAAAGCIPVITASIGASEWFLHDMECIKIARTPNSLKAAMALICGLTPQDRLSFRMAALRASRSTMAFSSWLPRIEQLLQQKATSAHSVPPVSHLEALRSAFQFLGEVWKDQASVRR